MLCDDCGGDTEECPEDPKYPACPFHEIFLMGAESERAAEALLDKTLKAALKMQQQRNEGIK